MLEIVTSANVSCGFHAGSPEGIRETLAAAVAGGVVIGAHPGYRDYENFGRTKVDIDSATALPGPFGSSIQGAMDASVKVLSEVFLGREDVATGVKAAQDAGNAVING